MGLNHRVVSKAMLQQLFACAVFVETVLVLATPASSREFASDVPVELREQVWTLYETTGWDHAVDTFTREFISADIDPLVSALNDEFLRPYAADLLRERLDSWELSKEDLAHIQRKLEAIDYTANDFPHASEIECLLILEATTDPSKKIAIMKDYVKATPSSRGQVEFAVEQLVRIGTEEAEALLREQRSQLHASHKEYVARYDFGIRSVQILKAVRSFEDGRQRFQYLTTLLEEEKPRPLGGGRTEFLMFLSTQIERLEVPSAIEFLKNELESAKTAGQFEYGLFIQKLLLRKQHLKEPAIRLQL